jgi:hypothetical protein
LLLPPLTAPHVLICVNSIKCGSEIEPYMQFELACYSIFFKIRWIFLSCQI